MSCARHKSTLRTKTKDKNIFLSAIDGNDKLMKRVFRFSCTKGGRPEAIRVTNTAEKFGPNKGLVSRQAKAKTTRGILV